MIPLSRVRLSPRKGGYMGVALHFVLPFFGPKIGPGVPQEPVLQHGQHKKVVIFVSHHDGNKKIGGRLQKIDFCPKNSIFGLKKGSFGQSGP